MESDAFEWQEMVCSFGIYGKKKTTTTNCLCKNTRSIPMLIKWNDRSIDSVFSRQFDAKRVERLMNAKMFVVKNSLQAMQVVALSSTNFVMVFCQFK